MYEQQSFYKKEPHCWIDLTDLEGVNGYCDENAGKAIRERIARLSPYGLHFIDSGNYHYVSKFWTDRIREDFVLVLFDHHTDMQPSRFGEDVYKRQCTELLKQHTGMFSNFRSTARLPIASLMAVSGNPESTISNALKAVSYTHLGSAFCRRNVPPLRKIRGTEPLEGGNRRS